MLSRLTITRTQPFAFGYRMLVGRAEYAVDPQAPAQNSIVDIDLAPAAADGLVHFSGDVTLLVPPEDTSNRRLFFDWGNRGNKRALVHFNDAAGSNDPHLPAHAGQGFLMRRGYTVAWAGWQGDLLPGEGRMTLDVPVACDNGRPVRGVLRTEYVGRNGVTTLPLSGWTAARSHPVADANTATLTRRRYATSERQTIPRDQWRFARMEGSVGLDNQGADFAVVPSRRHLHLPGGFESGWIYELIYEAEAPLVLGLGFAAVRDLVSYLRRDRGEANPLCGTIDHAFGWGRSQTGRALRGFVHRGFNADEKGNRVFDGVMPHVSGAGGMDCRRFVHLTHTASQQYEDHFSPDDSFPFSYALSTDHLTGETDAILSRPTTDPLVIHTQTSTEYWQRRGSLVHTDTQGADLAQPAGVRIYLLASSHHSGDPRLKVVGRGAGLYDVNVVATSAIFRALLDAMDRWVTDGVPPPDSRVPRVEDGTLVTMSVWREQFPNIPGVSTPLTPNLCPRLDHGPDSHVGSLTRHPPAVLSGGYAVLVPSVDADGNDVAGIRAPMVVAALATYLGWNLRSHGNGGGAMYRLVGSTIPLPSTKLERLHTGDPRRSVEERYSTVDQYVTAITAAALALQATGFLLAEDVPRASVAAADWGHPLHAVRI